MVSAIFEQALRAVENLAPQDEDEGRVNKQTALKWLREADEVMVSTMLSSDETFYIRVSKDDIIHQLLAYPDDAEIFLTREGPIVYVN